MEHTGSDVVLMMMSGLFIFKNKKEPLNLRDSAEVYTAIIILWLV